jgi:hypothetical protein
MQISEEKNKHYHIEKIHMANDCKIQGVYPPYPNNYGFFMIIDGKPNSGKTTMLLNMLKKTKNKDTLYHKFDKVFLFSASLHTIGVKLKLPDERMFDTLEELSEILDELRDQEEKEQVLIIIDDLISDINNSEVFTKMVYNRRHICGSISIIITTQVYNKLPLSIRKAADNLVIFTTTNKKELESIYQEYVNTSREEFNEIVKYSFQNNHDFLFIKTDNTFYRNFSKLNFSTI